MIRRFFLLGWVPAMWRPKGRARRAEPRLLPMERKQLLAVTSTAAISAELDHRWLSQFTLEELEAEAKRRGIR